VDVFDSVTVTLW